MDYKFDVCHPTVSFRTFPSVRPSLEFPDKVMHLCPQLVIQEHWSPDGPDRTRGRH